MISTVPFCAKPPRPGTLKGAILTWLHLTIVNAIADPLDWTAKPAFNRADWNQANAISWLLTSGTPQEDWINRIIELPDGSIVAAGFIGRDDSAKKPDWSAIALKVSKTGRLLWSRAFGGDGVDAAWAIREMPDHGLALGGFSSSESAGDWDAYLSFLREDGAVASQHRFGDAKNDRATDLLLTRDGNLLLIGETTSTGAGERDVFVVKTDRAGKEIWRKAYGEPTMDRGFAATETPDGNVAIIGTTGSDEKHAGLVLKIDQKGNQLWRTLIEGDKNVTPHFVSLANDKIVVVGYTDSWDAKVQDYFAATISSQGKVETLQTLGGVEDDRAMTSSPSADGGCWIVGYSKSFGATDWDILVAHLNANDAFEPKVIRVGTAAADHGSAIAEAKNGDLLIGGYTTAPSHGNAAPDLLVLRVDPKKTQRTTEGVTVRKIK